MPAPASTRALADVPDALRVMARTLHSDFRRDFTTDPPCIPVAPWTAMILVMIFIDEYLGGVERVDLKQ
jgi:hypothetical protein